MSNKDGGPAFPQEHLRLTNGVIEGGEKGMTLRDYFAAKAMQIHGTALSDMAVTSEEAWDELVSKRAYKTADAMLKARGE